jgi:hypothetical protein
MCLCSIVGEDLSAWRSAYATFLTARSRKIGSIGNTKIQGDLLEHPSQIDRASLRKLLIDREDTDGNIILTALLIGIADEVTDDR